MTRHYILNAEPGRYVVTGLSAKLTVMPPPRSDPHETAVGTAIRRRQVLLALRHKDLNETVSVAEFIRAIPPSERQYPATRTGVADDDFRPWCTAVFPMDWDPKAR